MSTINQIDQDTKAGGLRNTVNNLVNAVNQGGGGSVEVFDGLTSDSPSKALSARQGKLLDERITGVVAGNAVAQNPWFGKKYIAIGDSITDPTVNTKTKKYCSYIAEALGTQGTQGTYFIDTGEYGYDNIGVSGMTMLLADGSNRRSFVNELIDSNTSYGDRGPYHIDWTQYDVATILLGVNDCTVFGLYGCSLGQLYEPLNYDMIWEASDFADDKAKFYAAYELAIGTILTSNPNIRLLLCTPPNVGTTAIPRSVRSVAAAVREIANRYSCPVIDFYSECGVPFRSQFGSSGTVADGNFVSPFTSDGVHPNIEGHKRMAEIAIGRLLQLKPALPVLS